MAPEQLNYDVKGTTPAVISDTPSRRQADSELLKPQGDLSTLWSEPPVMYNYGFFFN